MLRISGVVDAEVKSSPEAAAGVLQLIDQLETIADKLLAR
jgi:hypothetical protein